MPLITRRSLAAVRLQHIRFGPEPAGFAGRSTETEVSLDGIWKFRTARDAKWRDVTVPHTWQIEPDNAGYMGAAVYRRRFDAPERWRGKTVRVRFEAVFHTAVVEVNGKRAGEHRGKGYTAFTFDITPLLRLGTPNEIVVRVDNAFNHGMLPRGKSYDWTPDGGIYRPVRLLITPLSYIERVDVDAIPDLAANTAALDIRAVVKGPGAGQVAHEVIDDATGLAVMKCVAGQRANLKSPKLWHFDHPRLYRLRAVAGGYSYETTFGIREIKVQDAALYLNGERVKLAGVERMAGSNPLYGMAEPPAWIEADHVRMKELNCVFTRVHWQQDRRRIDWCDRHGMLIREEAPTWGPDTFKGMGAEPSPETMNNGLEQLREMIHRDRNHPSIVSWGLCNEIGGQTPAAAEFARRMLRESEASRCAAVVFVRFQLAPVHAGKGCFHRNGFRRVERILRELVRRKCRERKG